MHMRVIVQASKRKDFTFSFYDPGSDVSAAEQLLFSWMISASGIYHSDQHGDAFRTGVTVIISAQNQQIPVG